MSLIPDFELGLWNACILLLWPLLLLVVLSLVIKIPETKEGKSSTISSKTERIALLAYHIIAFIIILYSVFLPLKLGTIWLYAGLTIYVLGMIMYMIVLVNFATTPRPRASYKRPLSVLKTPHVCCLIHSVHWRRNRFRFMTDSTAFRSIHGPYSYSCTRRRALLSAAVWRRLSTVYG